MAVISGCVARGLPGLNIWTMAVRCRTVRGCVAKFLDSMAMDPLTVTHYDCVNIH